MTAEILFVVVTVNLAVAAAILIVLLIGRPVRRLCGPDVAYGLWVIVPWFGFGQLVASLSTREPPSFSVGDDLALALGVIWMIGAAVSLVLLGLGQHRVARRARAGAMGPAVVGILRPRVFLPIDFETRFTPAEQSVIRAHERAHLLRHDVLANAAMAVTRAVLWFNPLVHLAAVTMRHHQEIACDATVLDERPEQRRRYAATLLKSQLFHERGMGTACAWVGAHPLEDRIRAVARGLPAPFSRVSATIILAAITTVLALNYTDDGDRLFRDIAEAQVLPLRR